MASADAVNVVPQREGSASGGGIRVDDLRRIDITQLSQSELMALSLSSASAFDLSRTEDVVSPQVDRSVFNESAGGRRQTYSRLHHRSYSRLPGLHPSLKSQRKSHALSDPVNHSVVHFLKHFIDGNYDPPPPPPPPPPRPPQEETKAAEVSHLEFGIPELQGNFDLHRRGFGRGKRLCQTKLFDDGVAVETQQTNSKGEIVDLGELEKKGDEIFDLELKKRTVGMQTEEAVLGFLWDLDGQWCSRRKKRKFVDAGVFAYALPIGWRVLLGIRRRDCRVSVYCRRFISPTGRQFLSCKEAALYLKSCFGGQGADQIRDEKPSYTRQNARPADKNVQFKAAVSTVDGSSSNDRLKGIEDLPEVQHALLSHQKTSKRHKFGRPVGEGVIIKDGKFECQFCHKVFDEKRSYSGHVGIHVRNAGKNSSEHTRAASASKNIESLLPEAVTVNTGASVKLAESNVSEASAIGVSDVAMIDPSPSIEGLEGSVAPPGDDAVKLGSEIQEDVLDASKAMIEDLNQCTAVMTESADMVKNDFEWNVNVEMEDASCMNEEQEHAQPHEIGKFEAIDLDASAYEDMSMKPSDVSNLDDKQSLPACSSVPLVQSFQFFPPFSSSNKVENEFSVADQKLESVTGFEELRFDDIEPFMNHPSLNLGESSSGIELGFNSAVGFGADDGVMLSNQLTVCVWCRAEFRLEGIESETPSDSIGYMCPTCKAKISGHFGGSLSMDLHNF